MDKLTLSKMTGLNIVKAGLAEVLTKTDSVSKEDLLETIKDLNTTSTTITLNDNVQDTLNFNLYSDANKKLYLFEARRFINDNMYNALLLVFDESLNPVEEYIDDVWSYADFKAM